MVQGKKRLMSTHPTIGAAVAKLCTHVLESESSQATLADVRKL